MSNPSNYLKNIATLATGSSVAQLIPILISPFLTRIYSPAEFGELAFFLGVCSIISIVVTGRYELAIVIPKSSVTAWHTFVLAVSLAFIFCILLFCAISFNVAALVSAIDMKNSQIWLYLIPFYTFLLALYQCFNFWATRNSQFKLLASNRVLQTGTTGGGNLLLGSMSSFHFQSLGLIFGSVAGLFVSILSFTVNSTRGTATLFKFKKIIAVSKRYKNFPRFGMFSSLFNACSSQAPVILLSFLFNSSVGGFYSLANRILVLPMSLIGGAVGQAFLKEISSNKNNRDLVSSLTLNTVRKLIYIAFIPMLLLLVYGDYLFSFVFGREWNIAGEYAQLLVPWMFLVFITSPISNILTCYERQKESLIFNGLLFFFRISALYFGWFYFGDIYSTLIAFNIVGVFFWFWFLGYLLKTVNARMTSLYKYFILFLFCALILFLIRFGVN
ncbi:oligosaccharide flippase family protein [Shewanella algae]|nr:oligosaccharide flippase family protein [Shewanella algae]